MIANIPEEIVIIARHPEKVSRRFHGLGGPGFAEDAEVRPAFIAAAGNEKTLETGREWARGVRWSNSKNETPFTEETRANTPFGGLRVVGLDIRSEGGRAWKVVDPWGHYVDLREDVLLEAMISEGVWPEGRLRGRYLWAMIGGQMKLIREGSQLHTAALVATERRKLPEIKPRDFVPGGIYRSKSGQTRLFVGWGNTIEWIEHGYDYRINGDRIDSKKTGKVLVMLEWDEAPKWGKASDPIDPFAGHSFYNVIVSKRFPAPEHLKTITLPADPIRALADEALRGMDERVLKNDGLEREDAIRYRYAAVVNLVPYGEEPVERAVTTRKEQP